MTAARDRARALRDRTQPPTPRFQDADASRPSPPPAVRRPSPETPETPAESIGAGHGRPKTVRQTVDLPDGTHQAFATWRMSSAIALGRTRLTTQEALHTVIEALVQDETVARRVRARLERRHG